MNPLSELRRYLAKLFKEEFAGSLQDAIDKPASSIVVLALGFVAAFQIGNSAIWVVFIAYFIAYLLLFIASYIVKKKYGKPIRTMKPKEAEKLLGSMSEEEKLRKSVEFTQNPPFWFPLFFLSISGIVFGAFFWVGLNIYLVIDYVLSFFDLQQYWLLEAIAAYCLLMWILIADSKPFSVKSIKVRK